MKESMLRWILLAIIFISCASQKTLPSSDRDGLSIEKAIVIKSIPDEYAWVKQQYPGSVVERQALLHKNKIPYDRLDVRLADGQKISIYFDISSFFGKGLGF
jgi:hypothetical protein